MVGGMISWSPGWGRWDTRNDGWIRATHRFHGLCQSAIKGETSCVNQVRFKLGEGLETWLLPPWIEEVPIAGHNPTLSMFFQRSLE
jgi:hypothetical protein